MGPVGWLEPPRYGSATSPWSPGALQVSYMDLSGRHVLTTYEQFQGQDTAQTRRQRLPGRERDVSFRPLRELREPRPGRRGGGALPAGVRQLAGADEEATTTTTTTTTTKCIRREERIQCQETSPLGECHQEEAVAQSDHWLVLRRPRSEELRPSHFQWVVVSSSEVWTSTHNSTG